MYLQAFSSANHRNQVMMYCFVTRQLVEQRVTHSILKRNMLTHLIVKPEFSENG